MKKQYPDVTIYYIDQEEYEKFERNYSKQIPNWEHKVKRKK